MVGGGMFWACWIGRMRGVGKRKRWHRALMMQKYGISSKASDDEVSNNESRIKW